MTEVLGLVILFVFLAGLFVGSTATLIRLLRYHTAHIPTPRLLIRDVIVQGGLATAFFLISVGRIATALGYFDPGYLNGQLWWIILTSIPAIIGVWTYAYYELFVIERADS